MIPIQAGLRIIGQHEKNENGINYQWDSNNNNATSADTDTKDTNLTVGDTVMPRRDEGTGYEKTYTLHGLMLL
jgi:hypothetical protein